MKGTREDSKRCPDCDETLPIDMFVKYRTTSDGYGTYCRAHHNARAYASREAQGGSRRYHFKRRYGVWPEHFDALLEAQNGLCYICHENPATDMDHDHKTGLNRKALCNPCNQGLGGFKDNPEKVLAAYNYLVEHSTDLSR